jgi:hypothetical protein
MSAFLLGWFRLIWLFTRGHQALVLENLALSQQLAVYKRHGCSEPEGAKRKRKTGGTNSLDQSKDINPAAREQELRWINWK